MKYPIRSIAGKYYEQAKNKGDNQIIGHIGVHIVKMEI